MERLPVYTDIMVDLETTHTLPDRGGILQIAAVKFNLKENQVSPDFFDMCLTVPNHRHWSEGTRNFWLNQKESVLQEILQRAEPWRDVMEKFMEYSYPINHLRFWSKPSHFDYNFLSSYFSDYGMPMPFHYRDANDMNSFLRGLYYEQDGKVPDLNLPFVGEVHNALFDTLHQVRVLLHHVHEIKRDAKKLIQQVTDATYTEVNNAGATKIIEG